MRKWILILVILLSFSFVYADELVDEYIEIIDTETFDNEELSTFNTSYDHEALSLFLTAHVALGDYDYELAYTSLEEALTLSESDRLTVEILYYLAMTDLEFNDTSKAIKRGLELKGLAHEIGDLKGVIHADRILSIGYYYTYDYDEARLYAEEALNLSRSIDYQLGIWEYYYFKGVLALNDDKFDTAMIAFEQAKEYYEQNEFSSVFYDIYVESERNIAKALYWQNRENKAINRLLPLLDLVPEENALLKAQIYHQLGKYSYGSAIIQQEHLLNALDYLKKSSRYEENASFENTINETLASGYYVLGEYHKAADYYHMVMRFKNNDEYYKSTSEKFEDLNTYKYDEVKEKIELLEELAETKSAQLDAQKKLLYLFVGGAVVLSLLTLIILVTLRSRNKSKNDLYVKTITDDLTSVYNRSRILELFEAKLEGDNAVILIDLDDFKNINDQYGHLAGDEILKQVAETLKHSVRGNDVVGRYGGDKFLVILDTASQDECRIVAERIRLGVEICEWSYKDLNLTCSVGVTRIYTQNSDEVLQYVDTLLNQAKSNGKNQVVYG